MPSPLFDSLQRPRAAAIASVDAHIARLPGGRHLTADELASYRSNSFQCGWSIVVHFDDGVDRELHVLADGSFPYKAPRIAVPTAPEPPGWPHLEADGLLCILPSDAAVSHERAATVVEFLLGEACKLVTDGVNGRNREDFRVEFLSYWDRAADPAASRFVPSDQGDGSSLGTARTSRLLLMTKPPYSAGYHGTGP